MSSHLQVSFEISGVAKNVHHDCVCAWGCKLRGRGGKREIENRAKVNLKLRGGTGFDGVVTGVVRARSDLVD